jgi:hypothetical protein
MSLLNCDGMCRHFQSALLKKIADGNNYVKEGLFSKLVVLRFFSSGRTKSFESQFYKTILADRINDDDDDDGIDDDDDNNNNY